MWFDLVLSLLAVPAVLAAGYLFALALIARRVAVVYATASATRFVVVVPAHDEEAGIAETVESLLAVDYPRDLYRVLVVADNCQDRTAARAAAAGAQVLQRQDVERRGKGHALADAFRRILTDGFADAIVVVDADTTASANLLSAFASRFAAGALALQADYGVRNARSSWRTRLMSIALGAFHRVRSSARERLAVSCGLRGNGMAFAASLLREHPPGAFSIVEDVEYGLQLGLAGVRVQYVQDAHVWGQMVDSERASRSQRQRWERGRRALVKAHVPRMLAHAWRTRDRSVADMVIDLIIPPLGQFVALVSLGLGASLLAMWFGAVVAVWLWTAALFGIVVYVLRGWVFSEVGAVGIFDLARAPLYIVWKLTLRLRDKGRDPKDWVRTTREARS